MRQPQPQRPKTTPFLHTLRPLVADGATHYIPIDPKQYWVYGIDWGVVLLFKGAPGWECSPRFESTGIPSEALAIQ